MLGNLYEINRIEWNFRLCAEVRMPISELRVGAFGQPLHPPNTLLGLALVAEQFGKNVQQVQLHCSKEFVKLVL